MKPALVGTMTEPNLGAKIEILSRSYEQQSQMEELEMMEGNINRLLYFKRLQHEKVRGQHGSLCGRRSQRDPLSGSYPSETRKGNETTGYGCYRSPPLQTISSPAERKACLEKQAGPFNEVLIPTKHGPCMTNYYPKQGMKRKYFDDEEEGQVKKRMFHLESPTNAFHASPTPIDMTTSSSGQDKRNILFSDDSDLHYKMVDQDIMIESQNEIPRYTPPNYSYASSMDSGYSCSNDIPLDLVMHEANSSVKQHLKQHVLKRKLSSESNQHPLHPKKRFTRDLSKDNLWEVKDDQVMNISNTDHSNKALETVNFTPYVHEKALDKKFVYEKNQPHFCSNNDGNHRRDESFKLGTGLLEEGVGGVVPGTQGIVFQRSTPPTHSTKSSSSTEDEEAREEGLSLTPFSPGDHHFTLTAMKRGKNIFIDRSLFSFVKHVQPNQLQMLRNKNIVAKRPFDFVSAPPQVNNEKVSLDIQDTMMIEFIQKWLLFKSKEWIGSDQVVQEGSISGSV